MTDDCKQYVRYTPTHVCTAYYQRISLLAVLPTLTSRARVAAAAADSRPTHRFYVISGADWQVLLSVALVAEFVVCAATGEARQCFSSLRRHLEKPDLPWL